MNEEKELIEEIDEQSLSLIEDSPEASSEILYEDTSKRSENVKHFRMKNGTYMAAVYDKPVHTMDKSTGKFVDIAHRFEAKEDCYEAETDHFKARFPKKEGKRKYVTMEKGERSVSWRYIPTTDSHKKRAEAAIHEHRRASLDELPQFPKLKYEKTEAQTDLEYGISEKGVKENIILSKRPKSNIFRFELKLVGLKAILSEDTKSIQLYAENTDGGEPEFVIPPINMTDGAGVYSEAAHYDLTEDENGTVMAVVIDPEWLFAEERLYPVTVDPQVVIHDTSAYVTKDIVTIKSNNTKRNSTTTHRAGFDKDGTENRIYLKPTFPTIPAGAKITAAWLNLKQTDYLRNAEYDLCKVLETWNKDTLTWKNQPSFRTCCPLATIESQTRSNTIAIKMDITTEAIYCYNNPARNYGFVIKVAEGIKPTCANTGCNGTSSNNYEQYIDVCTYVAGSSSSPSIQVRYKLVDEFADHQKYEPFSVGRAGDGAVNLFTGKLAFTHSDVLASGGKLPLVLSHIYRSDYADLENYDKTYGRGWSLSAAQTLELSNSSEVQAIYRDAQGRKHYFTEPSPDGCKRVYYDSAGLGLTFVDESTIIDEKDNSLTFKDGKLTAITDADGNSMTMTYDSKNRLIQVKDSVGRSAKLIYDEDSGRLTTVEDVMGRKIRYTYSSNDLTAITYPDGSVTNFTYSTGARLIKVTDQTGITYEITYTNAVVTKVARKGTKKVARGNITDVSNTNGGGIAITYRNTSTVVEDLWTHVRAVYSFDECGRTTYSYEDLTQNSSLKKGSITVTELYEYQSVLNRETGSKTNSCYTSVQAVVAGANEMHPNYLSNGDFSKGTSNWTVTGNGSVVDESYMEGCKSFLFSGSWTQKLQQTVTINSSSVSGNILVASAWAKSSKPTGTFDLYAQLTYKDGTTLERTTQFDSGCIDEWQYVAIPLKIEAGKVPASVMFKFECTNCGTCYVSNLRLTETRGMCKVINFKLNSEKTILSEKIAVSYSVDKTNGLQSVLTYYTGGSDAVQTEYKDEKGHVLKTYAKYDDKHRLVRTKDYRNFESVHSYDKFGNENLRRYYSSTNTGADLSYVNEYNSSTSLLEYAYDPRSSAIFTKYTYDTKAALLKQRLDSNGQSFNYSYDGDNDHQTAVTAPDTYCDTQDISNGFMYDVNYLTRVAHNNFYYYFAYDALGRSSSIKAADTELVSFTYTDGETSTVNAKYANTGTSEVTYDSHGKLLKKKINSKTVYEAEYDVTGVLKKSVDKLHDVCYTYAYSKDGKLTRVDEECYSTGNTIGYRTFTYDAGMRLVSCYDSRTKFTYSPIYEKDGSYFYPDNATLGVKLSDKYIDAIERDGLRRISVRKLTLANASSPLMTDTYGYLKSATSSKDAYKVAHETQYVKSVTQKVGSVSTAFNYTYDNMGNIATIAKGSTTLVKYTYDALNQLIQEDNYQASRRYVWTYDKGGNITSKKEYKLTSSGNLSDLVDIYSYTYNGVWKDKLASFDGQTISYDKLGNPTTYRGKTLSWTNVRRLASYGSTAFEYNAHGIRFKKNSTTYTLDGSTILKETTGNRTLTYYYGDSGVIGFNYNGTSYYYRKNLLGDVTAIYNASGVMQAEYQYDAWGKVLKVTNHGCTNIGDINPFRYRSYYYDIETGLYYLESRYYDPEVGRFINSDSVAYLGKGKELVNYNLFAYCSNNPVNRVDYAGTKDEDHDGDEDSSTETNDSCISPSINLGGGGGSNGSNGSNSAIQNVGIGKANSVHGNSKQSTKVQHGYEIYVSDKNHPLYNNVVKTGISGQKLNKNGTSPRANQQVNKWNKTEGNIFSARIVEPEIQGRQAALEWEQANTNRLDKEGHNMWHHQLPRPNWREMQ